ncbi:MAG: DJ-1/PfpI family protein [Kangiellaceae bacterium]|nr:DJ-1/PfpI family protein [Kangiellaceae bacterium]
MKFRFCFIASFTFYCLFLTNASAQQSTKKTLKPLAVIVAQNGGSEITDFMVPYSILSAAKGFEVMALSAEEGTVTMLPSEIQVEVDASFASFETMGKRTPDVVVVPAVIDPAAKDLHKWLKQQADNGALVVSICEGVQVLAESGLLNGKQATGYFFADEFRKNKYPTVNWVSNTRYVVDGSVMSSSGISASAPASIALVERFLGVDKALQVAKEFGISDYSAIHDVSIYPDSLEIEGHDDESLRDNYAMVLAEGVSEYALAFSLDMLARTRQANFTLLASDKENLQSINGRDFVTTAHGLKLFLNDDSVTDPNWIFNFGDNLSNKVKANEVNLNSNKTAIGRIVKHLGKAYGDNVAKKVVYSLELQLDEAY